MSNRKEQIAEAISFINEAATAVDQAEAILRDLKYAKNGKLRASLRIYYQNLAAMPREIIVEEEEES